jgi:hypothetical protein
MGFLRSKEEKVVIGKSIRHVDGAQKRVLLPQEGVEFPDGSGARYSKTRKEGSGNADRRK